MGYLDDHLLPGERVVHRARSHWIIFGWAIVAVAAGIAAATVLYLKFSAERYWLGGAGMIGLGAVLAIRPAMEYLSSEFAVTDKRVLAKFGVVRRQSLETLLSKVEAIGVTQDVSGRLLGYGTITITGTGGTREALPMIADPLEFRRWVQAQIVAFEESSRVGRLPASSPTTMAPRVERECPHCAELILAKAKVCKHCGRDVV